jgi:hypothetical protein
MVGWDSQIPNAQRSPDGSRFLTELSLAVTSKQLTPELKLTPAKIQSSSLPEIGLCRAVAPDRLSFS